MPTAPRPALLALALIGVAPALAPAAATIGSLVQQPNASAGHFYLGQTFTVPAGETGLTTGALLVHNEGATATGTLGISPYAEPAGVPTIGTPLAVSPFSLPPGPAQTLAANFNVPVTPGGTYILLLNWTSSPSPVGGYFGPDYYAGGNTILQGAGPTSFPGFDLSFEVNFGAIPEPTTLAALAGVGLVARRRRR